VLYVKAVVMSNFLFVFVKTRQKFREECYAKELMKLAGWRCILLWYIPTVIEWCSSEVISASCVNICLSD